MSQACLQRVFGHVSRGLIVFHFEHHFQVRDKSAPLGKCGGPCRAVSHLGQVVIQRLRDGFDHFSVGFSPQQSKRDEQVGLKKSALAGFDEFVDGVTFKPRVKKLAGAF